jgi:hypothetical protein
MAGWNLWEGSGTLEVSGVQRSMSWHGGPPICAPTHSGHGTPPHPHPVAPKCVAGMAS